MLGNVFRKYLELWWDFWYFSVFFRTFQKVFPLETESDFYQSIIAGESGEKVLVQTFKFFLLSSLCCRMSKPKNVLFH